jgi:hypothetical protein
VGGWGVCVGWGMSEGIGVQGLVGELGGGYVWECKRLRGVKGGLIRQRVKERS